MERGEIMIQKRLALILIPLILALTACNPTRNTPIATAIPTPTPAATLTALPATATLSAPTIPPTVVNPTLPASVPPTTPAAVPTGPTLTFTPPAAPQSGDMTLKIFLVAINDNGSSGKKIGCNDSLVGVDVQVPRTQAVLRAALTQLLALKDRDYGQSGLVNALYQSDLSIQSLAIQNGEAILQLSGKLSSGGVCDDPRIIGQLEQTALQFSTVQSVTIFVNGKKIQDLLSGRGG
jgi:hypothetical protein